VHVIVIVLVVILVLGWVGFEYRSRDRAVARTLFTIAATLALLLAGAFFGLYGT